MRKYGKIAGIFGLSLFLLATTACSDDYEPVKLVSVDNSEVIFSGNNNSLLLYPHSAPQSFTINGGDGAFLIENSNESVVSYKFDGRTLTIIPQSVGETVITISDRSGNRYELKIQIDYERIAYLVQDIKCQITGDAMTIGDRKRLEEEIKQSVQVAVGGRYSFVYHDKAMTEGMITIYPSATAGAEVFGSFAQKKLFTPNGVEYLHTEIFIGSKKEEFSLILNEASEVKELWDDVTTNYQGKYPTLEKAYIIQSLDKVKEDDESNK